MPQIVRHFGMQISLLAQIGPELPIRQCEQIQ